jgi:dihydroorotase
MAKTVSELKRGRKRAKPARPSAGGRRFDVLIRGGRVIDLARGIDGVHDVAITGGKIAAVAPRLAGTAGRTIDARNRLVLPGMIDTHCHIYQHVTGVFGMNPDEVGIRSGVTAVVDQGGAAPLTIQGFRKFIKEPATTRVYAFISNYLVGGLMGHRHVGLYGPHGINVKETVKAIEENRDIVKGIKCHAEVGGYSRWGIETLRLGKQASREARVPVYIHLGRLWAEENGAAIDPDSVLKDVVPLLDPGDVLAHPFTKHPGAFVSREGKVHPLIFEAMARGVRVDIGRGGHMSFNAARIALDAGVMPFTVGGDIHGYTIQRRVDGVWNSGTWSEGGQAATVGGSGVFTLVQVMNELMALGVGLTDVVKMVTANPATMLDRESELGSLAPGRVADVSVLALDEGDWTLEDSLGVRIKATLRLRPVLALRAGKVHRPASPLLREAVPEVA